jgi:hypothetical protein
MKLEDGKAFILFGASELRTFERTACRGTRRSCGSVIHANKDVTDRYAEQWRKEVAESAGLGFKLPNVESSVGLLGLPKQQKSQLKKVA